MPSFGAGHISDALFGVALTSPHGFPLAEELSKSIVTRLWEPEAEGGVKLLPFHTSQMILGLGHLDRRSRGPDLVATVISASPDSELPPPSILPTTKGPGVLPAMLSLAPILLCHSLSVGAHPPLSHA